MDATEKKTELDLALEEARTWETKGMTRAGKSFWKHYLADAKMYDEADEGEEIPHYGPAAAKHLKVWYDLCFKTQKVVQHELHTTDGDWWCTDHYMPYKETPEDY